jgi:hypothetical protein
MNPNARPFIPKMNSNIENYPEKNLKITGCFTIPVFLLDNNPVILLVCCRYKDERGKKLRVFNCYDVMGGSVDKISTDNGTRKENEYECTAREAFEESLGIFGDPTNTDFLEVREKLISSGSDFLKIADSVWFKNHSKPVYQIYNVNKRKARSINIVPFFEGIDINRVNQNRNIFSKMGNDCFDEVLHVKAFKIHDVINFVNGKPLIDLHGKRARVSLRVKEMLGAVFNDQIMYQQINVIIQTCILRL